jgi:hypothetical protein
MKKLLIFTLSFTLLAIWIASSAAVNIKGKKTDAVIEIETDMYKLEWKTANQAGYISAWVKKGNNELLLFEGANQGRRFYHSSNYSGWKDWGKLDDFKIVENKGGVAKVEFTMTDGLSKDYICTATFWDGHPLIRHEVKIKAKANVTSWQHGHEPMYEVRSPVKGSQKWDAGGGLFGHVGFWTADAFSALYATDPAGVARNHAGWQADGRVDLQHDALGKAVKKGATSDPLVYWVAFGVGQDKELHDLAETVADVGTGDLKPQAVNARGKASTTWGAIKQVNLQ